MGPVGAARRLEDEVLAARDQQEPAARARQLDGSVQDQLEKVAQAVGTPYSIAKPFSGDALEALVSRALSEAIPPHPPTAREAP